MTATSAIKAGLRRYIKDITFAKTAKKVKDPDRKVVGTPSKVTQEPTRSRIATEEFAGKTAKGHGSLLFNNTLKKIFGRDVGDVTMSVKQDMKSWSNRVSKNAKKLMKKDPSLSQDAAIKKAEKETAKMFGTRFFKGTRKKEVAKKQQRKVKIRKAVNRVGTAAAAAIALISQKDKQAVSAKDTSNSKNYKVKSGDTLSEIARDKGTTVGKIKNANPKVKNLNKITPGETIKIPMPKVKDRKSVYQDLTKEEMKKISMKKKYGGKIIRRQTGGIIGGGSALRGFGATRRK
tara:strand:+ start:61 stop:930 length:870 start_codon:yes stop_codon:yes gene_type:complete